MKVLQVHCTYQYQGGEDIVVANERELLRQKGVVVEELTFTNANHIVQKVFQAAFNLHAYKLTLQKIKTFRPDIVHIHNLHFGASPSVIVAIRKSGIPYVQTLHNYRLLCPSGILFHKGKPFLHSIRERFPWSAIFSGVYKNSRPLTAWLALSTKFHHWIGTWKQASKYIFLTRHAQSIFMASRIGFRLDQLAIKPNFSARVQSPGVDPADHFVYIGRLSEEKGIHLLLKAFSVLPYTIRIAGDGPLLNEVLAYSSKYPNIQYAGILSRDAVAPFLTAATALIFPSTWYEGMPMVVIEAFASGVPVIASRLGAMEEMITPGYNGFHFEAGQAEDLQQAITRYQELTQADKITYRRNAYRTYTDTYTPEINANQLLQIYHDAINAYPISVNKYNIA